MWMGGICCSHTATERNTLRVVVFGIENSGKTSLVRCLKTSKKVSKRASCISTHGVVAVNVPSTNQMHINLMIFDCGGCKHQRHIWPHLSNDPDLVIFTVDSLDSVCLDEAKDALFDLLTDECLAEKPLLIAFTKSDLQKNIDLRHLEEKLDLSSIQDRPIHKVRFSSVTLDGFHAMLTWFSYFGYCKQQGKPMKLIGNSFRHPSKYRLAGSLNLLTKSRSSQTNVKQPSLTRTNSLTSHSIHQLSSKRNLVRSKKKVSLQT